MCGISGIINKDNKEVLPATIRKMNDLIVHRGPDDKGFFFGENFAFGHRRLAILDLSEAGHQPMSFFDKYTLIFNGEIYNYKELKKELIVAGYSFQTLTDTEVILASYDKWGKECVNRFNGMWSFALYDKGRQIIFCSRDRFGIKPFYYTEIEDLFVFGSEIKQFTIINGWEPVINKRRALDFIKFSIFDHTEETLFQNVFQLRGGHNLEYSLVKHSFQISKWYELPLKKSFNKKNSKDIFEQFRAFFTDAVRLRLRSDVKVGSCLSGGLDSSAVVCSINHMLATQEEKDQQETVSSCSVDKKYDEQDYIDAVVQKTKITAHKIFPSFEELLDDLEQIIWHQDEPFGSTSIFAQWKVFAEANKRGLTVMLDGQGGDELLAGYPRFYGAYFFNLFKNVRLKTLLVELFSFKQKQSYSFSFLCNKLFKKLFPDSASLALTFLKKIEIDNLYKPRPFSNIYDLSCLMLTESNLQMLLHTEDRNSMAHSVESRVPFLDYRFVEFVLSLPDEYKIYKAETKWILRQSLKEIMPLKVINRTDKMGFETPESAWIKEHKEFFRKEFLSSCGLLEKIIDQKKAEAYFEKQLQQEVPIGSIIWRIICLGRWMRVFNVS